MSNTVEDGHFELHSGASLKLVQMYLNADRLVRFASKHELTRQPDEDLGFACHAWLSALFGEAAPQPFRLFDSDSGTAKLLAYTDRDSGDLQRLAREFADPLAFEALHVDDVATRVLPDTWHRGSRYGFEVLTCPLSRRDGVEKDVFLHTIDRDTTVGRLDRSLVYAQWLTKQLVAGANVEHVDVVMQKRVKMTRRGYVSDGRRDFRTIERMQVLFSGSIAISDADAFEQLLRRGIGRHRAFGLGMLLLRPV